MKFGDFASFKYGKMPNKKLITNTGKYPIFSGYRYVGYYDEYNTEANQLIIVARGVGGTGDVKLTTEKCFLTNLSINVTLNSETCLPQYLYYLFSKNNLRYLDSGSAQSQITISDLEKVEIEVPSLERQKNIVSILSSIDDKIKENNAINNNLEQQAFALFDSYFPSVNDGPMTIGDYIIPKRGKNLLSKDAIYGNVPVVAGGLEPATYHNASNTTSPVLTISASGANSGFVRLWNMPVWSSDSSFIDSTMTDDVYFWYVMLKKRQKEVYDSQTGSAQPHIYPQHIAVMPVKNLEENSIKHFTEQVTPLFQMIGANNEESLSLSQLRDALLPKLMSGELDVSDIKI